MSRLHLSSTHRPLQVPPHRKKNMKHIVTVRDAIPKLYNVWKGIRQRCSNPNQVSYKHYGARGVSICPEWDDYEVFFNDMGNEYEEGLSIDRKDRDKGYCKANCHWITKGDQSRNRPTFNRNITIDGATKTLSEWCREYGITTAGFRSRVSKGWTEEKAITTPKGPSGPPPNKKIMTVEVAIEFLVEMVNNGEGKSYVKVMKRLGKTDAR